MDRCESVEEFLSRGGEVKRLEAEPYTQSKTSRYRLKDVGKDGYGERDKRR